MQLEALTPTKAALTERIAPHWRLPLLRLALAWAALLALFARDWADMALQWWDASTYNHILLVPFIIGWLVVQRAPELAKLTPSAWWPGLVLLAGACFVWLLGDVSGLATANHLGAVGMLMAAVVALLGPRVSAGLLFPLLYALFLVPLGEELVPALQMITAHLTIALTHASGIPALVDGVFIDTPAGLFEVAEACSGVKFLVAMIALGALVAHVCFRSWTRRVIFMTVAIVLPILANGVRAWGTIYIAQSQGIAFAEGFDHIFYGWIFFALVMGALLAMAWRFFDRRVDDAFIDADRLQASPLLHWLERAGSKGWPIFAGALALALAALAWSGAARSVEAPLPATIALPQVPGWTLAEPDQSYPWQPRASGADRKLAGSYIDGEGRVVDVVYALYAAQEDGREAGAFGEGALPLGSEWRWLSDAPAISGATGDRLQAVGAHQRVALTWLRHGDWVGASKLRLKLATMRDRMLLRAQPTAMLIVSAEERAGQDASATLSDFLESTAPVGEWMDRIGSGD